MMREKVLWGINKLKQDNKLQTKVIINKNRLKYKLLEKRIIINNRENYLE